MSETEIEPGSNASNIKPIDALSAHKITSGQVVIDLQTAVKELVENSLDAGATSIEVRFKNYGLESIEVIDNGSGISPADYDAVALKHHTSKLTSFNDLSSVATFGFRGEALSSLCALSDSLSVITATTAEAPMGTILAFDKQGRLSDKSGRVARQHGTTVIISGLFKPLPVRRKELERNTKREFGKALHLLYAYALVPCASENGGVRLACTNQAVAGKKSEQFRTDGTPSTRASISALWGPKTLDHLDDLDLKFDVETEKSVLRRLKNVEGANSQTSNEVHVRGIISKFALSCGRNTTDRQFFFINGRPCQPSKVQKAFNEVYRTFNATQSPLVIADFILPKNSLDINVSPDKRTIFIHSEDNLIQALKVALEERFAPERSTYNVHSSGTQSQSQVYNRKISVAKASEVITEEEGQEDSVVAKAPHKKAHVREVDEPLFLPDEDQEEIEGAPEPVDYAPLGPDTGDPTLGFGMPVLLLDSVEESFPAQSVIPPGSTESQETAGVSLAAPEFARAQEDSVDVDIPSDDGIPQRMLDTRVQLPLEPDSSPVGSNVNATGRQANQLGSPRASPSVASSVSRMTEGTIHQIPPPRSLSRKYTSSSTSATSSSSVRSAVARPLPAFESALPRSRSHAGTSAKRDAAQMVLSTSGAAWSLQPQDDEEAEQARPRKRPRPADSGQDRKRAFKTMLAGYARPGSQVEVARGLTEEEQQEEEEEEEEEEEAGSPGVRSNLESEHVADVEETHSPDAMLTGEQDESQVTTGRTSSGPSMPDVIGHTARESSEDVDMTSETRPDVDELEDEDLPEIVKSADRVTVTMRWNTEEMVQSWARLLNTHRSPEPDGSRVGTATTYLTRDAGLANIDDAARADETLSRVIEKTDFANMEVVGQFNLGFIIVRRRKRKHDLSEEALDEMDDLFIVDQHAADEKYNFETLQQSTKIESQKLFQPKPLELSASDELIALDNLDILRQNGFEVAVTDGYTSNTRHRLSLVAHPISKSTAFDLRDLEELIHLLQDNPAGQMVRCSKARSMFAMRACRMSIMVGMPLTVKQMTNIVRHMGTMYQPWNCPHGRPTMRHLSDISRAGSRSRSHKDLDWESFLDTDKSDGD